MRETLPTVTTNSSIGMPSQLERATSLTESIRRNAREHTFFVAKEKPTIKKMTLYIVSTSRRLTGTRRNTAAVDMEEDVLCANWESMVMARV